MLAVRLSSVFWGCGYPYYLIRTLTPTIPIGNGSAHAVKVPGLIFLSGQVPADKSGKIVDGGIQEHTVRLRYVLQTEAQRLIGAQAQCISNLGEVLEAAGSSWEKVVKVNVYLKDMNDFSVMNGVYEKVNSNRFYRDPLFFNFPCVWTALAHAEAGENLHSGCYAPHGCRY